MLQIEQNFIKANKETLNITEYNKLSRSIETAQKKKFYTSLKLGAIITQGIETFKKDETFKESMSANGITWSIEDFINNVYGIQKSFAYKVSKASKHEQVVLEAFEQFAEEQKVSLSIAEFNKFAKNVGKVDEGTTAEEIAEEQAEEQAQEQTDECIFSFVSKFPNLACNMNVMESGVVNTASSKEDLLQALEAMKVIIENNL